MRGSATVAALTHWDDMDHNMLLLTGLYYTGTEAIYRFNALRELALTTLPNPRTSDTNSWQVLDYTGPDLYMYLGDGNVLHIDTTQCRVKYSKIEGIKIPRSPHLPQWLDVSSRGQDVLVIFKKVCRLLTAQLVLSDAEKILDDAQPPSNDNQYLTYVHTMMQALEHNEPVVVNRPSVGITNLLSQNRMQLHFKVKTPSNTTIAMQSVLHSFNATCSYGINIWAEGGDNHDYILHYDFSAVS